MQKVIYFLLCLLALGGCIEQDALLPPQNITGSTQPSVSYTEPTADTVPEKTIEELVTDGTYMLKRSFGFYQGSVNMAKIQTITFSRIAPSKYDECWSANLANTNDIVGYRVGLDVIIVGDHIYANNNCTHMFAAKNNYGDQLWASVTEINGLELLNTSYVNKMTNMFFGSKCVELPGIEIWDVSNVIYFDGMFQGNDNAGDMKLQYLDVSGWNTSSAQSMSHMFYGCGALTHITIDNWDVSNVTTFSHMFADCFSLQSINLLNWDTSSVISFDCFLNDCRSLVVVDVSGLETSTCTQFSQMFEACVNLQYIIGLNTWDVSGASNYAFSEMFHGCYSLAALDIGGWQARPDNTSRMFKNCFSLTMLDMSGFDMTNASYVVEMFMGCSQLTEVIGMDTWNLADINGYDSMYIGTSLAQ